MVASSTRARNWLLGRPSMPQATLALSTMAQTWLVLEEAKSPLPEAGAAQEASRRLVLRASKNTSSFSHSVVFLQRMTSSELAGLKMKLQPVDANRGAPKPTRPANSDVKRARDGVMAG